MEGSPDDRGVNFRAIEAIINTAKTHSNGLVYDLELSMLEIYNEAIRDLLRKPGSESPRLDVTTATGVSIVKGLDIKKVSTMEEIEVWIARGASHRAAGAHALNKDSSRSHSIVTLYIKGTMPSGDILRSKLNLVDLAGSERLDKTGATGDRLTEAKAINKSLSALGDVIAALSSEKKVHVPFRNSKLTYLLQDSLAGDSKALMIVTASPEIANANETICSLKFASRCHDCALGVARKNVGRKPLLSKFRP
mmetsp:Transcript_31663/g.107391  ORF Transcript_31663/g.107391 Transcript_31663/m.107391 type:complete len:251 (+) Transcript_31663:652-1404(+)